MEKDKIITLLKSRVFIGIICFLLGGIIFVSTCGKEKLKEQVLDLSGENEEKTKQIEQLQTDVEDKKEEITALKTKVDEAKPWFEMKEEERKAEEERLAAEKAKKEEEEKAAEEAAKKEAQEAEAKKYETGLTYEDIARNPDLNSGKLLKVSGKILQVIKDTSATQYRMAIDSDYDKVVLIQIDNSKLSDGNILEDDVITIDGRFVKEVEYTTVMGAKQSIPYIQVDNLYR